MEWEKMVERLTALLNAGKHSELRGALMMLNEVDIAHFMRMSLPPCPLNRNRR